MEPKIEIDIEDINERNLKDIPEPCKGCVYWEFPKDFEREKKTRRKKENSKSRKKNGSNRP